MPRKSAKKQTRLAFAPAVPSAGEDSEKEDRHRTLRYNHPSLASVRSNSPRKDKKSKSSKKARTPEPQIEIQSTEPSPPPAPQLSSEEEDDIVLPSSSRKRKAPMSPPKTESLTRIKHEPVPSKSLVILSDSEDDEDPVVSSPTKRRRRLADSESPTTPRAGATKDDLEVAEDVLDLQDSDDSGLRETRTRGRIANSARSKRMAHLETLRRRRAGQKLKSDPEKDDEPRMYNGDEEPTDDSEINSLIGEEDLDAYDEDFVQEDDTFGVPTEMPLEFTRHAYKKPKEYFQDVVGWMVHNYLDPAFPRSDAMYEVAFMKLNDEVNGRASSQFTSSSWSAEFRNALLARPYMELLGFKSIFGTETCEACNRSGHPPSWEMKLYGKPYSLETLEPLDETDETDEENDGHNDHEHDHSNVERDREGHVLPDENRRFLLGRHCKDNATLAHQLTHWRFTLNEWVVNYLESKGHKDDAEVLRRSKMKQKHKTRHAIDVHNTMISTGEVEKMYRDFHIVLKSAREKPEVRFSNSRR
ncbi:hypothetical protein N7468_002579 [Penicillium chermesinum]|uniref:DUF4211 domain-containing protein n=1 Tax=Penicillium chermesinum TaxID=63820 RepID=A0A9W9TXN7_9EURO|nr:uncharacterized protein N7468_002579 [Penicillium chermesinum]KAJ5247596.1 hypothetical protein N7468_002579 [Penicillium chermesinum]KAJ6145832.1 hypothetical protein N7470_009727 [Penicillium chermesinum]